MSLIEPRLNYVTCPDATGGHRMAYWQWGRQHSGHVVVCVHGLTRQGRDFDVLARALCDRAEADGKYPNGIRVICPDVAGRGQSEWLKDSMGYQIPNYAADMLALFAQLHADAPITTLDWVGTSMGGLIGIVICGQAGLPLPVQPRRLVLNDIGPTIEWKALERIGTYLGQSAYFSTVQEAADTMWAISSSFGPHTPEEWLALSGPMVQRVSDSSDSKLRLHYDPAIATPFKQGNEEGAKQGEAKLWQLYDAITAQTLLTRGAISDLLSLQTALTMQQRGPKARLVEFAGVGHAPTFVAKDQMDTVARFLLA